MSLVLPLATTGATVGALIALETATPIPEEEKVDTTTKVFAIGSGILTGGAVAAVVGPVALAITGFAVGTAFPWPLMGCTAEIVHGMALLLVSGSVGYCAAKSGNTVANIIIKRVALEVRIS